ncbi:MAG: HNH endonuclease [Candidatus Brocadiaceae bacterium]|nr:HNH endonuclease [Candidatus Brocadiaceae bacterium]
MTSNKYCEKCIATTERYKSGRCKVCHKVSVKKYKTANHNLILGSGAEYRRNNKEKVAKTAKAWRDANKQKQNDASKKWAAKNPERVKQLKVSWNAVNKQKIRAQKENRRSRKLGNGGVLSDGLGKRLFCLQRGKCACCGKPLGDDYHLDHRMPLVLGGSNTDENMQLLTKLCNLQKSVKHPIDFMQGRGFLL